MASGGYLGRSTVIKTFTISGKSNRNRLKGATEVAVKGIDKTNGKGQIISADQADEKAAKNRERIERMDSQRAARGKEKEAVKLQQPAAQALRNSFTAAEIGQHLKQFHPGCPKFARKRVIKRVREKSWQDEGIGKAVGICMENYLRHEITGYDKLLILGVDRHHAKKLVRAEIDAVLSLWAAPAAHLSNEM